MERADGRDYQARALATLVVPTYNAVAFVAATMDRLRGFLSRHPEWRGLFVCDGCTDATPEVLQGAAVDPPALGVLVMQRHGRQMLVEVLRLRRALRRHPVGAQSGSASVPVADRP